VAKRLKPVPVEAIARGYLIGSGWKEYQAARQRLRHRAAGRH
jgi:phosphoribosylaminoimidazole-succinocarboxamide synthase